MIEKFECYVAANACVFKRTAGILIIPEKGKQAEV